MSTVTVSSVAGCSPSGPRYSINEKIDICRGLFAFLVVSAHALELASGLDPIGYNSLTPWFRDFLTYVAGTGLYYVMGFFILSGYCIQLSVTRLSLSGSFPLKIYLLARLTRILPLYYLALLVTVVVEQLVVLHRAPIWPNGLNPRVFVNQILMIQNLTQTYGSFAPSWSITNEVIYYLFFGGLAAMLARSHIRPATLGMALCIAVGAVTQIAYRTGFRSPVVLSTGLLFGLGFNWFLGALIAVDANRLVRIPLIRLITRLWLPLLTLTMMLWFSQRVHQEFIYIGAGLAFALLLIRFLVVDTERVYEPRSEGADPYTTLLGLASYPTYLFHGPILLIVGSVIRSQSISATWWMVWLMGTSVGIFTGLILGFLAEQPILAWRSEYLKRLKHSRPARSKDRSVAILDTAQ